jgi:hypothetical protein
MIMWPLTLPNNRILWFNIARNMYCEIFSLRGNWSDQLLIMWSIITYMMVDRGDTRRPVQKVTVINE